MKKTNFKFPLPQLFATLLFILVIGYAGTSKAEDLVYDEVIFAPVVLSEYEGQTFLDVEEMDGNVWGYAFKDYNKHKAKLNEAMKAKTELAFYLQLGEIVSISNFEKEMVYIYPTYSETKHYFALNFSFVEASARLRLKVTKEDNPLSYKISEQFLRSFGDIVNVYYVDGELVEIYANQ